MYRSWCALVALSLASAALAAPAPQPIHTGWSPPQDPDGDCKFLRGEDSLTVEMPGTDHDYDPLRRRENAPRILRDVEGDFLMQVRLKVDARPSASSTAEGQPSSVGAGFLLIPPKEFAVTFIRMEYRVAGTGEGADGYTLHLHRGKGGGSGTGVQNKGWKLWPFKTKPEHVHLRLERKGDVLYYQIGPDGESWVGGVGGGQFIGLPPRLKVGLAASSSSAEPSSVRFDQFKFSRGTRK